ncbi:siderophore synthetase component [Kushneria sinocarnis]|uniref:Siderophore synthetase component n=1 Tax=Kushneria sinocarnis TaxID=595502 RepID=A0A420WU31_9GAMM|nr:IucA/IucC family protein [Kushneria sinocarnis]RKQ96945.1 siderophore synthetase component [Kushneria sinocarnis]
MDELSERAVADVALRRHWEAANRALIAKMISELAYEQVLAIVELSTPCVFDDLGAMGSEQQYDFALDADPRGRWTFLAQLNLWGQLLIDIDSLTPPEDARMEAADLLLALGPGLGMDDARLAESLEDLFNTLRADCELIEAHRQLPADRAIGLPEAERQALLDGHPKFLFNKGRRGWGLQALRAYAPEYGERIRLDWVAILRARLQSGGEAVDSDRLLASVLDEDALAELRATLARRVAETGYRIEQFALMPVHPWQWQQMLAMLHAGDIGRGEMIHLGSFGDEFIAQQSLRTLTNVSERDRAGTYDVKLPLSIMNTSSYRGIPGRYMLAGPAVSHWLRARAGDDDEFVRAGLEILAEPASAVLEHDQYARLPGAPYRYRELCGVIWREGLMPRVGSNEQALLMAELMQSDADGRPWLAAYIDAADCDPELWLSRLFEATLIPMYHLLCRYGMTIIAHGQNLTLILRDGLPHRLALKDFQGDLRLIDEDFPEAADLPRELLEVTVRLPADKLIHDLQTGHFVTLLRFVAPLAPAVGISERRFYQLCAEVLETYMARHSDMAERFAQFSLFRPRILRLGLNRSKFLHDAEGAAGRMLPDMDYEIDNPLALVTRASRPFGPGERHQSQGGDRIPHE